MLDTCTVKIHPVLVYFLFVGFNHLGPKPQIVGTRQGLQHFVQSLIAELVQQCAAKPNVHLISMIFVWQPSQTSQEKQSLIKLILIYRSRWRQFAIDIQSISFYLCMDIGSWWIKILYNYQTQIGLTLAEIQKVTYHLGLPQTAPVVLSLASFFLLLITLLHNRLCRSVIYPSGHFYFC